MTSRTVITIGVVSCASNRSALLRRVFDTAELIDLDVLIVHLSPFSFFFFFFSSRRRHTRSLCDWSSDVCSSDLARGSGLLLLAACISFYSNSRESRHACGLCTRPVDAHHAERLPLSLGEQGGVRGVG